MCLPLAERMVEKMVKEEKIEAEAEVSLHLSHWGYFQPEILFLIFILSTTVGAAVFHDPCALGKV